MKKLRYRLSNWWYNITFVYKPFIVTWNELAYNGIRFRCAHFETQKQAQRFCKRLSRDRNFLGIVSAYRIDRREA